MFNEHNYRPASQAGFNFLHEVLNFPFNFIFNFPFNFSYTYS